MSQTRLKTLVLICFLVSLTLLIAGSLSSNSAAANDASENEEKGAGVPLAEIPLTERQKSETPIEYTAPKGPITVPVYPRGAENAELPKSTDLRDSYIVMKDGSVLSVADWILGSLKKDQAGIGMTDYENRLFLGQVARAAVGMDENMIKRSLIHTQPTATYRPAPALSPAMQVLQSAVSLVKNAILPGRPYDWDPATSGGGFNRTLKVKGDSTYLFDRQFTDAMEHTNFDLRESGIMQNMIRDQKKLLAKQAQKTAN